MRTPGLTLGLIALAVFGGAVITGCGGGEPSAQSDGQPQAKVALVAKERSFDHDAFAVRVNEPVSLTLRNQSNETHNWRLLGVRDKEGKEVATGFTKQNAEDSITFTVGEPGTFSFQCDTHAAKMRGRITVVQ